MDDDGPQNKHKHMLEDFGSDSQMRVRCEEAATRIAINARLLHGNFALETSVWSASHNKVLCTVREWIRVRHLIIIPNLHSNASSGGCIIGELSLTRHLGAVSNGTRMCLRK